MSTIYSNGELRFFRLAKGVVDYSTAALREVFKQEWNNLYPSTPWQNNSRNGSQLLAEERPPSRRSRLYDPTYSKEYQHIKDHLSCGNVEEWDVTTLVFALNYSHALSRSRFSHRGRRICNAIHQLKEVRNVVLAHACRASISRRRFERNIDILSQAVGDLLTNSDPLVEKLQKLLTETEFLTEDLVRYKQWLKDDHDSLLSLERDLERLENKMKITTGENDNTPVDKTGSSRTCDNSEIISRLRTQVAKLDRQVTTTSVDQAPSRSKPEIFHSNRYIKMIDESNSLRFNFRWEDLEKFLQGFSSHGNMDIKLFAGIQQAAGLSHHSKKKDEILEVLNGLIPGALMANNG